MIFFSSTVFSTTISRSSLIRKIFWEQQSGVISFDKKRDSAARLPAISCVDSVWLLRQEIGAGVKSFEHFPDTVAAAFQEKAARLPPERFYLDTGIGTAHVLWSAVEPGDVDMSERVVDPDRTDR